MGADDIDLQTRISRYPPARAPDPVFASARDDTPTPLRRFLGWRWWRGWRGWLIFAVVTALVSTIAGIGLAQAFSDPAEPWSQYPGVPQVTPEQVLHNETVEELSVRVDATMAQVREAITEKFGFTWTAKGEDVVEYESNRFHGTSLLNTYDSVTWQTDETLRSQAEKNRAVALAIQIMRQNGFGDAALQNFSGADAIAEFGDFRVEDQGRWVVSGTPPNVSRGALNFVILDLSHDRTRMLADRSESDSTRWGWESEYLSISYSGDFMLKDSDRAEFERRAKIYEGHIQPVPGRNTD